MVSYIPHLSDLPAKLRTAINQAYYAGTLQPRKDKIFHTFYSCPIEQVQIIIIHSPEDQINLNRSGLWKLSFPLTWVTGNYNCHKNLGWEQVVSDVIKLVDNKVRYKVYMLIGGPAQSFSQVINKTNLIIKLAQPSDLTADIINEANDFIERKRNV